MVDYVLAYYNYLDFLSDLRYLRLHRIQAEFVWNVPISYLSEIADCSIRVVVADCNSRTIENLNRMVDCGVVLSDVECRRDFDDMAPKIKN